MKERPIIFSGEMVRAILAGRKTQTRRVMAPTRSAKVVQIDGVGLCKPLVCPYGESGDRLWLRETWCYAHPDYHDEAEGRRRGDRPVREYPAPWWCHYAVTDSVDEPRWRSPRYMPRWASRITLEVVSVRVQQLHNISEEDARAEGVDWAAPHPYGEKWDDDDREDPREVGYAVGSFARDNFRRLWDSINGKDPAKRWDANPLVWAVEFRRVER